MTDNWEQQPGGLWLKVSPYDKNNPQHIAVAENIVRGTIQTVSSMHGAAFNEKGFRENMRALNSDEDGKDLQAHLFWAQWDHARLEICERKLEICEENAICLGAALGWETYGFTPDGELVKGWYTEDFSLLRSQRRELIRHKPDDLKPPDESVAECLERISLRQMAEQGVRYRYGEVAPDNTTMMRQLNGNRVVMKLDSAVLEYDRSPDLLDYLSMNVKVLPAKQNGIESKRSFRVHWQDDQNDVRFIVTKGWATSLGKPRVDIRSWDNGQPIHPAILECAAADTLRAIAGKAAELGWNPTRRHSSPSPSIPDGGSRSEHWKALIGSTGAEVNSLPEYRSHEFYDVPPPVHVHIIGQAHMIKAFKDAETRFFGNKPMVPAVNILPSIAQLVA